MKTPVNGPLLRRVLAHVSALDVEMVLNRAFRESLPEWRVTQGLALILLHACQHLRQPLDTPEVIQTVFDAGLNALVQVWLQLRQDALNHPGQGIKINRISVVCAGIPPEADFVDPETLARPAVDEHSFGM